MTRCLVMGILNLTPDSFSDGGDLTGPGAARERALQMIDEGADILDVGGESTRPGHQVVPVDEEIRRVVPVIEEIRDADRRVPISIDTSKGPVAAAALRSGATIVNDVAGGADSALLAAAHATGCEVILMRSADCHGDIVQATRHQLQTIRARAIEAGISETQIVLDPGLGFGARPGPDPADNLALVDAVQDYAFGHRVLIGASRKRFIGELSGIQDPKQRLAPSVDVAVRAAEAGAAIVRVHDVEATVRALRSRRL